MTRAEVRIEVAPYPAVQAALQRFWQDALAQEPALAAIRGAAALELLSLHALALDDAQRVLGTVRLTPDRRVGPLYVATAVRGQGIGQALLARLVESGRQHAWPALTLEAPVDFQAFYARQGFIPVGDVSIRDGVDYQQMRRALNGALAIETLPQAAAACLGTVQATRRTLCLYSRELDPGLLDQPALVQAIRRLCTGTRDAMVQILLHDALAAQQASSPLIALSQRLPSRFTLRQVQDPVDQAYASAYVVNDRGGYYFRTLGNRLEGEADMDGAGRARQLRAMFASVWERARPCTELRALGL
ncbi:MAG: GNAT family N-acetyltransferase [Pseudoxanthomonas sp.]